MKCPKYIEDALIQRARYASRFLDLDVMIGNWLEKQGLIDQVEMEDIHGGCESILNPYQSSDRVLEVIRNA